MKAKKILFNLIYLLIMSTFFFDSYIKLSQLDKESDLLRAKYPDLQDLIKRHTGYQLPYNSGEVAQISQYIVGSFAVLQSIVAMFVVLGQKQLANVLIVITLIHTFVMHNPYYRNTTEIDKQRCFKHILTDLSLIATLFIFTGMCKIQKEPQVVESE